MSKIKTWNFNFYFVTWNVGSKYPENISLHSLLGLEKNPENDSHLPDFYVVCFQEVNSQPQNLFLGLFKDDPWTAKLKDILKIRDYVVVQTEQLQGMLIVFFGRRKHLLHLRDIETEVTRTGLGGVWGNKGAVSIRVNLYGRSFCYVNSHLAAHDHMLEDRINDYEKIMKEHKYHVKESFDILSHDYIFWMGDLNFRLAGETISAEEIREEVQSEKLNDLLKKDQLRLVMSQNLAFTEFNERLPAFPPTFKFEQGTAEYDMKRRPAWTDRILYRVKNETINNVALEIQQTSYKSHPTYTISDHKPVTSEFVIKITKMPKTITKFYDSIDGDTQTPGDDTEPVIEFANVNSWTIGEENIVEYTIPHHFEEQENDWIGIYKHDFASLNEYLSYEYANRSTSVNNGYKRLIKVTFPDEDDLPDSGQYVLVYFQCTGSRNVTGLAGISNVFTGDKRSPSPRFDSTD